MLLTVTEDTDSSGKRLIVRKHDMDIALPDSLGDFVYFIYFGEYLTLWRKRCSTRVRFSGRMIVEISFAFM